MKKAYNVYRIYGKADIDRLVKAFSLALVFSVCFLGFQSQTMAQTDSDVVMGITNPQPATNLVVLTENFQGATMESFVRKMKTEVAPIYGINNGVLEETANDSEEMTQFIAYRFMINISVGLEGNPDVPTAVHAAYNSTLASIQGNVTPVVDPRGVMNDIIDHLK